MLLGAFRKLRSNSKKKKNWANINRNNGTICVNDFKFEDVTVGQYTYGPLTVLDFGKKCHLTIGSFCSIASGVVFNLSGDHPINRLSTFPFKAKALRGPMNEATSKGDILIGDDVWIGQNAIILSGISIGQGSIVAAGAVVTTDIPPYAIVGGVPAKVIKYRFSESVIEYLLSLDYSSLNEELIELHINDLYQPIEEMQLEEIKKLFFWFPKITDKEMKI